VECLLGIGASIGVFEESARHTAVGGPSKIFDASHAFHEGGCRTPPVPIGLLPGTLPCTMGILSSRNRIHRKELRVNDSVGLIEMVAQGGEM
jgi:hypothetical protein